MLIKTKVAQKMLKEQIYCLQIQVIKQEEKFKAKIVW